MDVQDNTANPTANFMVVATNDVTRRRAQAALMQTGGELGFHWRFEPIRQGGVFSAHADAKFSRYIRQTLEMYMAPPRSTFQLPHGEGWMLSGWGEPLEDFCRDEIARFVS
jgi:hypothetical protein